MRSTERVRNAGVWTIGRLQTDADRERVVEGLTGGEDELSNRELGAIIKRLSQRWFVFRNARSKDGTQLFQSRWAMSWMRGPMTRSEIRKARELQHKPSAAGEGGKVAEAPDGVPAGKGVDAL